MTQSYIICRLAGYAANDSLEFSRIKCQVSGETLRFSYVNCRGTTAERGQLPVSQVERPVLRN